MCRIAALDSNQSWIMTQVDQLLNITAAALMTNAIVCVPRETQRGQMIKVWPSSLILNDIMSASFVSF